MLSSYYTPMATPEDLDKSRRDIFLPEKPAWTYDQSDGTMLPCDVTEILLVLLLYRPGYFIACIYSFCSSTCTSRYGNMYCTCMHMVETITLYWCFRSMNVVVFVQSKPMAQLAAYIRLQRSSISHAIGWLQLQMIFIKQMWRIILFSLAAATANHCGACYVIMK